MKVALSLLLLLAMGLVFSQEPPTPKFLTFGVCSVQLNEVVYLDGQIVANPSSKSDARECIPSPFISGLYKVSLGQERLGSELDFDIYLPVSGFATRESVLSDLDAVIEHAESARRAVSLFHLATTESHGVFVFGDEQTVKAEVGAMSRRLYEFWLNAAKENPENDFAIRMAHDMRVAMTDTEFPDAPQ